MLIFLNCRAGFYSLAWALRSRAGGKRQHAWLQLIVSVLLFVLAWCALPTGLVIGKMIGRLLMPTALFWLLLWAWSFWAFIKHRGKEAFIACMFETIYTVIGNAYLGSQLLQTLEAPYQTNPLAQDKPFDLVLRLGGGIALETGSEDYELSSSGDRVAAARLYQAGLTKQIWLTSSPIVGIESTLDVVHGTTLILKDLGVPEDAIKGLDGAYNTVQEAKIITDRLQSMDSAHLRIGLVTSAWHMPRALTEMFNQSLHFEPLAADRRGNAKWDGVLSVIPTSHGFSSSSIWAWERLGMLQFHLKSD